MPMSHKTYAGCSNKQTSQRSDQHTPTYGSTWKGKEYCTTINFPRKVMDHRRNRCWRGRILLPLVCIVVIRSLLHKQSILVDTVTSKVSHTKETNQFNSTDSSVVSNATPPGCIQCSQNDTLVVDLDHGRGFAGCLIVMDDNHFLIEWLAYHWLTLPLKRLIIAVDPRSRTSPLNITRRYTNNGLMNITLWEDHDFMPDRLVTRHKIIPENDTKSLTDLFLKRQIYFYSSCLQTLSLENHSWVSVVDSDEYILPNDNALGPMKLPKVMDTVFETLNHPDNSDLPSLKTDGCIVMPRVQIGVKESPEHKVFNGAPRKLNASKFQTLRWRYRGPLHKGQQNGKSMIDVSRLRDPSVFSHPLRSINAHRAVRPMCASNDQTYEFPRTAPFIVHHYAGTYEQWSFRKDARDWVRQQEEHDRLANISYAEDDSIRPWLRELVWQVGRQTAFYLLEGVGVID